MIPVVWVTQVYPRCESDGLGRFLHLLARELPARGFDVQVIAPAADGVPDEETRDGVRIRRFRYAPAGRQTLAYTGEMHREARRHPWRFVRFVRRQRAAVADALREGPPAILHAHWWVPAGLATAAPAQRFRIPFVLSLHGTDVRLLSTHRWARPVARRVLRRADRVLPVSTALLRELDRLELGGGPRRVLPMPADDEVFHPGDATRAEPVPAVSFVVAARLTAQKSVDVAIGALGRLADRGETPAPILHVAGDGAERPALERLAAERGVADRTVFHGTLAPTDLARLLRECRAVILPSVAEGYGLTLVEGALCGVPGIGARSGGIEDLVEPGVTGLLFEPGDADGLAEAMEELRRNPDRARELGRNARQGALAATPGPLADRLAAEYRLLAGLDDPTAAL